MKDSEKTKEQLIDELRTSRQRIAQLEEEKTSDRCVDEIAEKEQTEESLRESEEKYRLLIENGNDAIFIAQDAVLKFCNNQTEKFTGYSKIELSKIPFVELIHPDDRQMVFERHKQRLSGKNPPSTYSFRIINKDGKDFWVELSTVLIDWEGRPATLNFLRDIDEQKKLEEMLQHAQKMEAVGTLAGGVAHDFNNLLMGIQGNTSLMLFELEASHPYREYLNNIEKLVRTAADLTNQLLGYAQKGKYHIKPLNLNEVIEKSIDGLARTRKEIAIQRSLSDNLFTILADRNQIEQVILDLFVNASDAMPDGGKFIIKTSNVNQNNMKGKLYDPKPGNYAKLTISDTGNGMDKETQERIFDPFFTTKQLHRGAGLGLASVYGIIKSHGGYIDVGSEIGQGTTFNIFLPATDQAIEKFSKTNIQKAEEDQTILLVDDEVMVLDVGAKLLKKIGYNVLEAKSGSEALKVYNENKDTIDMVILDMILPEISGGEVYDKIKEINPTAKVLLSSGYSINGQATEILKRGCDGFIQKPFSVKELSAKVRGLMT